MARARSTALFGIAGFALAAILIATTPVRAVYVSDAPDTYFEIEEDGLKQAYLEALSSAGESSTGKLVHFYQISNDWKVLQDGGVDTSSQIIVHVVQDRGLPRGEEYPTYVFTTVGDLDRPQFVYKIYAETRIYYSDVYFETGCLLSAKKGYSDICLADVKGNIAPDLPGLREDFWSDLIKLFGL